LPRLDGLVANVKFQYRFGLDLKFLYLERQLCAPLCNALCSCLRKFVVSNEGRRRFETFLAAFCSSRKSFSFDCVPLREQFSPILSELGQCLTTYLEFVFFWFEAFDLASIRYELGCVVTLRFRVAQRLLVNLFSLLFA